MDDENPTEVTAGAIVTVTVSLTRRDMSTLFGDETVAESPALTESAVSNGPADEAGAVGGGDTGAEGSDATAATAAAAAAAKKPPAWLRQKKSAGKKKDKRTKKAPAQKSAAAAATTTARSAADESPKVTSSSPGGAATKKSGKEKYKEEPEDESEDSDGSDADAADKEDRSSEEEVKSSGVEDDDQEWEKFQNRLQKREKLEGKSKQSHAVHCPMFPTDKQEYWWTYICDRKSRTLLTAPYHVTSLVDREDVQLKFTAPSWPGVYTVTCCLRSDSYLGFDQQRDIKLDVKEAPAEITEHPQWEFDDSEDEGKAVEESHESEYTTDEDVADDDD